MFYCRTLQISATLYPICAVFVYSHGCTLNKIPDSKIQAISDSTSEPAAMLNDGPTQCWMSDSTVAIQNETVLCFQSAQ